MIKTILAATDGSSHARKAIELAIEFASKFDAGVVGSVSNKVNHLAKCTCVCVK